MNAIKPIARPTDTEIARVNFQAMWRSLIIAVILSAAPACAQPPLSLSTPVTLRDAKLPSAIKRQLATVISSELDRGELDIEKQRRLAYDSFIRFPKLRSIGGSSAILLEPSVKADLCAPNGNGNCPSWLFLRQGKTRLSLLLEDDGEGISISKTSHAGMHDLVSTSRIGHTPLTEVVIELQFDGKTYQQVSCSESTLGGDEDDTEIPLHPCGTTVK